MKRKKEGMREIKKLKGRKEVKITLKVELILIVSLNRTN